ncbi:hypothetical protein HU715_004725 [Pseudomonas sp. SWRI12]|uniref:Uncharacterized protein n=1 Tax=Pseudomonas zanjanensis TaxID=2745496 RepID=A0A923F9X0_9PSED|nr:hypothetical protein [Pseudomonas zanjanensis]MBV4494654.1 hypothetical protein [Pseudomonas zanjanensis]
MFKRLIETKISAEWLFDKFWPVFWMSAGGLITAQVTSISDLFKSFDPLVVFTLSIIGAYLTLGFYFLIIKSQKIAIQNRRAEQMLAATTTNPLEKEFKQKIININDFYDPYYTPHIKKSFVDCQIIGPGNLLIQGGQLIRCELTHVQIAIIKDEGKLFGVTILDNPIITNTMIANCTLLMTLDNYNSLSDNLKKHIPVINR